MLDQLSTDWQSNLQFLVPVLTRKDADTLQRLLKAGLKNIAPLTCYSDVFLSWRCAVFIDEIEQFEQGDVVAVGTNMAYAHVLIRESDLHHTVFLTNRCNSNCLMCSQPPTPHDDSWLAEEACQVAEHMRTSPPLLGFSGGEPLLLGSKLRQILDAFILRHPATDFDILSNGRLLANKPFADQLIDGLNKQISWMIPLYGHADFLHDFVVQSPGAFEETLIGLMHLHAKGQAIQLRTVLIRQVLETLPIFCEFIAKNLPFVREVALMACEPIGFALANREISDVDLREWQKELAAGIGALERAGVRVVLMNTPLCVLPTKLWKYAQKSISDWKRVFATECSGCSVKADCAGLFSWHSEVKQRMKIHKIEGDSHV